MNVRSGIASLAAQSVNSSEMRSKVGFVEVDEVHLVDAEHEVAHLQQRRDHRVAAGLLEDALARVEQDHREVRGRRAGDHVARVLHVAGRVGDDELALRGREVAVRDVDRDALLALGPQAVGEQREVRVVEPLLAAGALDRLELVLEDLLAVEEQAPDERALAVVDGTGSGNPEELHQMVDSATWVGRARGASAEPPC